MSCRISRVMLMAVALVPATGTVCLAQFSSVKNCPTNVPATMEIEILDPNADPLGQPAVELRPSPYGGMDVDIPPVVLVHRYYYSGDRSFQAQLLPGGPSIVVANHPRTGERNYIEVQMMPGAPRVIYTKRCIEYDYGEHGISIVFVGRLQPMVKYRNGKRWSRELQEMLHTDQIMQHADQINAFTDGCAKRCGDASKGVVAVAYETTRRVALPAVNLLQLLPFGKVIFDQDLEQRLVERGAKFEREMHIRHAEKRRDLNDLTIPTNIGRPSGVP